MGRNREIVGDLMEDKKDKSVRMGYLENERDKQARRKSLYLQQLGEIRELLGINEKEIRYNKEWIGFHENAIERHKEAIKCAETLDEKEDQEKKLKFHAEQIESHHMKYIEFHKNEVEFIKKEIQLFEEGIKKCEKQLEFLQIKIEENSLI